MHSKKFIYFDSAGLSFYRFKKTYVKKGVTNKFLLKGSVYRFAKDESLSYKNNKFLEVIYLSNTTKRNKNRSFRIVI